MTDTHQPPSSPWAPTSSTGLTRAWWIAAGLVVAPIMTYGILDYALTPPCNPPPFSPDLAKQIGRNAARNAEQAYHQMVCTFRSQQL